MNQKKYSGVELFSGSGTMTKNFRKAGIDFISVDIRKRKGICEPDLRLDISKLTGSLLIKNYQALKCNILWIGLPCDIWSYASGGYHLDKNFNPKTEKAIEHLKLLNKCLALIEEINPDFWFIENPRGILRHYPPFIKWLKNNQAFTYELTMSSYGFPTTKPTNIFSNAGDLKFKELDKFGRGAKCSTLFDNLTKCQRQAYSEEFCNEIVNYIKTKLYANHN